MIIRGARQVGKTWLMKNFGEQAYQKVVYINFENNNLMKELFDLNLDVDRILTGIELYSGQKVDPSVTLLIFDEVQEVPKALTSLKYFNENAPELHIICAGSLLGIALHAGTSFPVGKVEFLDLHPMTFLNFAKRWEVNDLWNCYIREITTWPEHSGTNTLICSRHIFLLEVCPNQFNNLAVLRILKRFVKYRIESCNLMNRIFQNMLLRKQCQESGCYGTAFQAS